MKQRQFITLIPAILLCLTLAVNADSVRLASSNYYPHYAEDITKQGAVSEIVRQAFLLQNVEVSIEFMPFARALHQSRQAEYAGLIGAWYDDERAEHFYYSEPIYNNEIVFFKQKNFSYHFRGYDEIAAMGIRLGLVRGYLQPTGLLRNQPNLVMVATDEQALLMLAKGRVDLVPADKLNGLYLLHNKLPHYAGDIDWLTPALEQRPMYLIMSKQDPRSETLMQQFNKGLVQLRQSGQLAQILNTLLPPES